MIQAFRWLKLRLASSRLAIERYLGVLGFDVGNLAKFDNAARV